MPAAGGSSSIEVLEGSEWPSEADFEATVNVLPDNVEVDIEEAEIDDAFLDDLEAEEVAAAAPIFFLSDFLDLLVIAKK